MAYDPQARRRRPKPVPEGSAPVDALLAGATESSGRGADTDRPGSGAARRGDGASEAANGPPPTPAVTPEPANPPPDKLLLNSALVGALGTLVAVLVLRCLRKRWFRNTSSDSTAATGP
ncbi:MAG: hypothetical protein OXB92_03755 [Acidimicrobiaceae bacterium]|nr:hypothetical protein [Acidimicrobiaceae bacterium]